MDAEDFYLDLLERRAEVREFSRDDATKQLLVIGDFVTSLEIDGLSSWLYSISAEVFDVADWAELSETAFALQAIGATRSANVLLGLIPRLSEHQGYENWRELLRQHEVDLFEDDLDEVETIWELAERLVPRPIQEASS